MPLCLHCHTACRRNDASVISCDACKGFLNAACADMTEKDIKTTRMVRSKLVKVLCKVCDSDMTKYQDIKSPVSKLQLDYTNALEKLTKDFETQLSEIKTSFASTQKPDLNSSDSLMLEEIVNEVNKSQKRKQNLIIFGVLEQPSTLTATQRSDNDNSTVDNILKSAYPDFSPSNNLVVHRLGRSDASSTRPRPIKVRLNDESDVYKLLRNAKSLKNNKDYKNISLATDRTPKQIAFYNKVKQELNDRTANGEQNLKSRYVNGIPTILH